MFAARITVRPTGEEISALLDAGDRWARQNATSPLSDHLRLALESSADPDVPEPSAIVVTLVETSDDRPDPSPRLVAYAVGAPGAGGMICEAGARPADDHPTTQPPANGDGQHLAFEAVITLADAAIADASPFQSAARQAIIWWVDDPTVGDAVGPAPTDTVVPWSFSPDRTLYEMRIGLADAGDRPLASVATRPFVVGQDERAWLRVNNRAFAGHAEQAGWDEHTLELRLAEPWFDPTGFRLYEIDGELAAFCWTKLHLDHDPVVGEIYVIAVDPAFHGRGLGRELTLAGLDAIAARGVGTAILYVDAANEAAVHLYRSIGFTVARSRTAYRMTESTANQ